MEDPHRHRTLAVTSGRRRRPRASLPQIAALREKAGEKWGEKAEIQIAPSQDRAAG